VSSPRTVIVGSAVPLLLLAGFVCLPTTRQFFRGGSEPAASSASFGPASRQSGNGSAVVRPASAKDRTVSGVPAAGGEKITNKINH